VPKIFPFRALRPRADMINKVSAKSTDFPNKNDLIEEIRNNKYTFHHVTKSHLSYSGAFQEPEKFLPFASRFIKMMKENNYLIKEEKPSLYIYEQFRPDGRSFKGLIALCSIQDYQNNKIKKHEEIRPSRLKFLVELFKTTKVMGEPTLLAHSGKMSLDALESSVLYDFESRDGKRHLIKRVSENSSLEHIQSELQELDSFYIADGHHRSASTEEFNHKINTLSNDKSMCFILHEDQLEILPFHRLIKTLVPITESDLISLLSKDFKVSKSESALYELKNRREFGMYIGKNWYKLQYEKQSDKLDVEILEDYIVKGIFSIADSRTDSQITFHAHTIGEEKLIELVNKRIYNIAFTTKECTFEEVRKVSDMNSTLPPKSTYIEPKLRAGMIIQEFEVLTDI